MAFVVACCEYGEGCEGFFGIDFIKFEECDGGGLEVSIHQSRYEYEDFQSLRRVRVVVDVGMLERSLDVDIGGSRRWLGIIIQILARRLMDRRLKTCGTSRGRWFTSIFASTTYKSNCLKVVISVEITA